MVQRACNMERWYTLGCDTCLGLLTCVQVCPWSAVWYLMLLLLPHALVVMCIHPSISIFDAGQGKYRIADHAST